MRTPVRSGVENVPANSTRLSTENAVAVTRLSTSLRTYGNSRTSLICMMNPATTRVASKTVMESMPGNKEMMGVVTSKKPGTFGL